MYETIDRLELNIAALEESIENLKIAIEKKDENKVYKALGETLLWICTTDEWYTKHRVNYLHIKQSHEKGKLLFGVRYAYNSFKHNMDIIRIHQSKGGLTFPTSFPLEFKPIKFYWAEVNEKFVGYENQKESYKMQIMGKELYSVLRDVTDFLLEELYKVRGGN